MKLTNLVPPRSATLEGSATGALGFGRGVGRVTLTPDPEGGTWLVYDYTAEIGGKVAAVGGRLLDAAARLVIGRFFAALARRAEPSPQGFLARLRHSNDEERQQEEYPCSRSIGRHACWPASSG